jgi:hypothetical protein
MELYGNMHVPSLPSVIGELLGIFIPNTEYLLLLLMDDIHFAIQRMKGIPVGEREFEVEGELDSFVCKPIPVVLVQFGTLSLQIDFFTVGGNFGK